MIHLELIEEETNCIYSILATICYHYKLEYDYLFTGLWGFQYLQSASKHIGNRISSGVHKEINKEIMENKAKLIMNIYDGKSERELHHIIHEKLNQNMPIVISSDLFWCPWSDAYQKHAFPHYYIIVGMEGYFEKIICTDPYLKKKEVTLDRNTFWEGYKECLLYERNTANIKIDQNFVPKKLHEVVKNNLEKNMFSQMRQFAFDVTYVDFANEINKDQELYSVLLFDNIKELIICRKSFKKALTWLNKNSNNYNDALECLNESIKAFEKTRLNLMKFSLITDYSDSVKRCASWISNIADVEERMACILNDYLIQI